MRGEEEEEEDEDNRESFWKESGGKIGGGGRGKLPHSPITLATEPNLGCMLFGR